MRAILAILLLLTATAAQAADKPVPKQPYKVCLSQAQAAEVYKGKRLKYREIGPDKCWYAGATLPKHVFVVKAHPRAVGTAVKPTRLDTDVQARVQGPVVSITTAGATPINTEFTARLIDDAFMALTGRSEHDIERATFEAMWARTMRDAAGMR